MFEYFCDGFYSVFLQLYSPGTFIIFGKIVGWFLLVSLVIFFIGMIAGALD